MSRNRPLGVLTKASLEGCPWLCQVLRSIEIVGKFLEDFKKEQEHYAIKPGKETQYVCQKQVFSYGKRNVILFA